jgi:hypothetical protein
VGYIDLKPNPDFLFETIKTLIHLFICIEYYATINSLVLVFRIVQVVCNEVRRRKDDEDDEDD